MSNSPFSTMYLFLNSDINTTVLSKGGSPNGSSTIGFVHADRKVQIGITSTQRGVFWLKIDAYRKVR